MAQRSIAMAVVVALLCCYATAALGNNVTVDWTAPGDNGLSGTATSYDMRYGTDSLTVVAWANATQVSGEPAPRPAGQAESLTIAGLANGTKYYFGLKACDEANNCSPVSNVSSKFISSGPESILVNGTFEYNLNPWQLERAFTSTTLTRIWSSYQGSFAARVTVTQPGQYYQAKFKQTMPIVAGRLYHLEYAARASVANRVIVVGLINPQLVSLGLWTEDTLSTSWRVFRHDFRATGSSDTAEFSFYEGAAAGWYDHDALSLLKVDETLECRESDNLLANGSFDCSVVPLRWQLQDNYGSALFTCVPSVTQPPNAGQLIVRQAGQFYETQVYQLIPVANGTRYRFHLDAAASAPRTMTIGLTDPAGASLGLWWTIALSTTSQSFDTTFTATGTATAAKLALYAGSSTGTYLYDDAYLGEVSGAITTDVPFGDDSALEHFRVWPNPTRGSIQCQLQLRSQSRVSFELYDLSGRLVYELGERQAPAGPLTIDWDGRATDGQMLVSGRYILRLRVNGQAHFEKLTLLR